MRSRCDSGRNRRLGCSEIRQDAWLFRYKRQADARVMVEIKLPRRQNAALLTVIERSRRSGCLQLRWRTILLLSSE